MAITDPWAAYCLDSACGEWGRAVENALSEVEGKTKDQVQKKSDRVIKKWLDIPLEYRAPGPAQISK